MKEIDAVIDDVARRMTAPAASIDFRTRVLARLDDRQPSGWTWRIVPLVGAVAAVGLAVAVFRHAPAASNTGPVSASDPAVAQAVGTQGSSPQPQAPSSKPRASSLTPHAPTAEQLAWRERAIPALSQPDALTLESIQPAALEIRPLDTKPLVVAPISEDIDRH